MKPISKASKTNYEAQVGFFSCCIEKVVEVSDRPKVQMFLVTLPMTRQAEPLLST